MALGSLLEMIQLLQDVLAEYRVTFNILSSQCSCMCRRPRYESFDQIILMIV